MSRRSARRVELPHLSVLGIRRGASRVLTRYAGERRREDRERLEEYLAALREVRGDAIRIGDASAVAMAQEAADWIRTWMRRYDRRSA